MPPFDLFYYIIFIDKIDYMMYNMGIKLYGGKVNEAV